MASNTKCGLCGHHGPGNEYHPFAFCVMVKQLGSFSARVNLDAVLNHGRLLERLRLPNDATLARVTRAEEAAEPKKRRRK